MTGHGGSTKIWENYPAGEKNKLKNLGMRTLLKCLFFSGFLNSYVYDILTRNIIQTPQCIQQALSVVLLVVIYIILFYLHLSLYIKLLVNITYIDEETNLEYLRDKSKDAQCVRDSMDGSPHLSPKVHKVSKKRLSSHCMMSLPFLELLFIAYKRRVSLEKCNYYHKNSMN